MAKSTPEHFWSRINVGEPDACWLWTGPKVRQYGYLKYQGERWRAHRLAYHLTYNTLGKLDQMVCHKCDNPPCCNPKHLFLGTAADNTADMIHKGRCSEGELHPISFLTENKVQEIVDLYATGMSQRAIAERYSVAHRTIGQIVRGQSWVRADVVGERGSDKNRIGNMSLTDEQVLEVKKLYASKEYNQKELAELYSVHPSTISLIVRGKRWTHLG